MLASGGAGGARTHDLRIMSRLGAVRLLGVFQPGVGTSALVERCENDNRLLFDLVGQRPRKAPQGHLPDSRAPLLVDHDRRAGACELLARFTGASTTWRKRAPRPLRCCSYQSSASAISPAASGWNSTRTLTAAGGCRQPVRALGPSQRSRRPPTRSRPSAATTHHHARSTSTGSSKLSSSSRLASSSSRRATDRAFTGSDSPACSVVAWG